MDSHTEKVEVNQASPGSANPTKRTSCLAIRAKGMPLHGLALSEVQRLTCAHVSAPTIPQFNQTPSPARTTRA